MLGSTAVASSLRRTAHQRLAHQRRTRLADFNNFFDTGACCASGPGAIQCLSQRHRFRAPRHDVRGLEYPSADRHTRASWTSAHSLLSEISSSAERKGCCARVDRFNSPSPRSATSRTANYHKPDFDNLNTSWLANSSYKFRSQAEWMRTQDRWPVPETFRNRNGIAYGRLGVAIANRKRRSCV